MKRTIKWLRRLAALAVLAALALLAGQRYLLPWFVHRQIIAAAAAVGLDQVTLTVRDVGWTGTEVTDITIATSVPATASNTQGRVRTPALPGEPGDPGGPGARASPPAPPLTPPPAPPPTPSPGAPGPDSSVPPPPRPLSVGRVRVAYTLGTLWAGRVTDFTVDGLEVPIAVAGGRIDWGPLGRIKPKPGAKPGEPLPFDRVTLRSAVLALTLEGRSMLLPARGALQAGADGQIHGQVEVQALGGLIDLKGSYDRATGDVAADLTTEPVSLAGAAALLRDRGLALPGRIGGRALLHARAQRRAGAVTADVSAALDRAWFGGTVGNLPVNLEIPTGTVGLHQGTGPEPLSAECTLQAREVQVGDVHLLGVAFTAAAGQRGDGVTFHASAGGADWDAAVKGTLTGLLDRLAGRPEAPGVPGGPGELGVPGGPISLGATFSASLPLAGVAAILPGPVRAKPGPAARLVCGGALAGRWQPVAADSPADYQFELHTLTQLGPTDLVIESPGQTLSLQGFVANVALAGDIRPGRARLRIEPDGTTLKGQCVQGTFAGAQLTADTMELGLGPLPGPTSPASPAPPASPVLPGSRPAASNPRPTALGGERVARVSEPGEGFWRDPRASIGNLLTLEGAPHPVWHGQTTLSPSSKPDGARVDAGPSPSTQPAVPGLLTIDWGDRLTWSFQAPLWCQFQSIEGQLNGQTTGSAALVSIEAQAAAAPGRLDFDGLLGLEDGQVTIAVGRNTGGMMTTVLRGTDISAAVPVQWSLNSGPAQLLSPSGPGDGERLGEGSSRSVPDAIRTPDGVGAQRRPRTGPAEPVPPLPAEPGRGLASRPGPADLGRRSAPDPGRFRIGGISLGPQELPGLGTDTWPGMTGTLAIRGLRAQATAQWPILAEAAAAPAASAPSGRSGASGGRPGVIDLRGYLDLSGPRLTALATATMPRTDIADPATLARLLRKAKGLELTGGVALDGQVAIDGPQLRPRLTLTLDQAGFVIPARSFQVTGLSGAVTLDSLSPLSTPGGQSFKAATLRQGKFIVTEVSTAFQLEGPDSLLIEKIDAGWVGGRVFSHAVRLKPSKPVLDTMVFFDGLKLGELIDAVAPGYVTGSDAIVNGRAPVRIDGRRIDLGAGFLDAVPAEGLPRGHLSMVRPAAVGALLDQANSQFVTDAAMKQVKAKLLAILSDYEFELLRARLKPEPGGLVLTLSTAGRKRPAAPTPGTPRPPGAAAPAATPADQAGFTINVHGFDQTIQEFLDWKPYLMP